MLAGDLVRIRRADEPVLALEEAQQSSSDGGASVANPLDNPVWHALIGPHADLARGSGAARHYPRDMAPFSAVAEPTAAAYADLRADLPAGTEVRLFRPGEEPAPAGWET